MHNTTKNQANTQSPNTNLAATSSSTHSKPRLFLSRVLEADLGSGVGGAHGALHISLSWGSSGEESSSGEGSQGGESSLLLLWSLHINKKSPNQ